ncbi:aromatic acid exporter family protein [Brevibacillus ruminantium]|uniref:Aromatic acid exporter family protein n=1 Tax=Brevibacillus ruminantium TaxID=2950604 RepID=A0ABY4WIT7_9BACL|nr:aromatic acid exporter family protein [Brevibacillus ruminantium]USG66963.1 aromatic acid exporter family protein [Brevibacillus ruminantium]
MALKLGYRTIKTAIGTGISILIAQQLGLAFYASAGIITILCIQVTRKQSFRTALNRFLACLLGLVVGVTLYALLGFQPVTLTLLILTFLPLAVRLGIQEGFVTSMVVLLHLYSLQRMDLHVIGNELALIVIGVGVALLANLYMPSLEKELKGMQSAVERNFATILQEFCYYLRHGQSDWDGHEMIETEKMLKEAKLLAVREVENRIGRREEDTYYEYFVMREKQFDYLERMLPIVSTLNVQVPQGHQIADFLDHLSHSIHPGNTAYRFLDKLSVMREEILQSPLPQTRDEFETQAALFYLLREIEQYLYIKHKLGRKSPAPKKEKKKGNSE